MSMLSTPRFALRLLNWEEALSVAISVVKGHYGGDAALDGDRHPYLNASVQHLLRGDPSYVQRFLGLWATVPGRMYKVRLSYPVVWNHSRLGPLRFRAVTRPANARPRFGSTTGFRATNSPRPMRDLDLHQDAVRPFWDAVWGQ